MIVPMKRPARLFPDSVGTCEGCDGSGFRPVGETYVDSSYPIPDMPPQATVDEQMVFAAEMEKLRERRNAAANSVVPCGVCNLELYERWGGGHLHPDHNRSACAECRTIGRSTRSRKSVRVQAEPERSDLD